MTNAMTMMAASHVRFIGVPQGLSVVLFRVLRLDLPANLHKLPLRQSIYGGRERRILWEALGPGWNGRSYRREYPKTGFAIIKKPMPAITVQGRAVMGASVHVFSLVE
jgi:hypothetical protein